jgi:hypothetical protein
MKINGQLHCSYFIPGESSIKIPNKIFGLHKDEQGTKWSKLLILQMSL